MMEVFPIIVIVGLLGGIVSEVVEPAAKYAVDKSKAGYEYVQEKLD
jgi:xanthosine utilization system XapX-like protein